MSIRARLVTFFEKSIIILGLFSFWPYVFGVRSLPYYLLLFFTLFALITVFVLRLRRARAAFDSLRISTSKDSNTPFYN